MFVHPIRHLAPILLASGLVSLSVSGQAAARTRMQNLAGPWIVTAVRVADSPVQAVEIDDPLFMGAVLTISPARMAWRVKEDKLGSFADTCPRPALTPTGAIRCATGPFGPPGARLRSVGRTLRLDWYDGAILILTRAGR